MIRALSEGLSRRYVFPVISIKCKSNPCWRLGFHTFIKILLQSVNHASATMAPRSNAYLNTFRDPVNRVGTNPALCTILATSLGNFQAMH